MSPSARGVHILVCDLTDEAQYVTLVQTLELHRDNSVWGHFAPACGTASKAREKPAPHLEAMGISVPQPCRSPQHPWGLPHLSGLDKIRTEAANLVDKVTCKLILLLVSWQVVCSLENPENSLLFWMVPCVVFLLADLQGFDDTCLHGRYRKKSTRCRATHDWFQSLAGKRENDGSHIHNPWVPTVVGNKVVYPTAEEAAYPLLLCSHLAAIVQDKLLNAGAVDIVNME